MKVRTHNEWFRPVFLSGRKSCPTCHCKLRDLESIWSWGEYRYAKWRTVKHFCCQCFRREVLAPLMAHTDDCGCKIEFCGQGCSLPVWLKFEGGTCDELETGTTSTNAGNVD